MPHKKGKKKTTPKHKKKGVKFIAKHKICTDTVGSKILLHPNTTSKVSLSHSSLLRKESYDNLRLGSTVSNQPTYKKRKNITNTPKKGKVSQESLMQQNNNKNIIANKKRRLPVEVMPSNRDDGSVRVIDNLPELKTFNTSTVFANLTQAKKIREQVWIHHNGKKFETKCYVTWCTNKVDVFNFQVGHDTPKALGGSNELLNLKPICQNCNQSMGSRYSIAEWNQLFAAQRRQMSTMIDRQNSVQPAAIAILPIEYEKIDLSANILAKQQPINILAEQEVPISPIIQQTEKMQSGNTQHANTQSRNMFYGPLARIMPMHTNRTVIVQSAVGMMVFVSAWVFGF